MNVFEDLIEELKEENLLEKTVTETNKDEAAKKFSDEQKLQVEKSNLETAVKNVRNQKADKFSNPSDSKKAENPEPAAASAKTVSRVNADFVPPTGSESIPPTISADTATDENEFSRRRAAEEIASLKIVEHILSGVEREQLKITPRTYNDIAVGMALHDFLQAIGKVQFVEQSKFEFKLMQETERWYSALAQRDEQVSAGDLRRYCETTRPLLSSQALISLARFYRNSPFSEIVRSKFDLVATRLFTKELSNHLREMVVERSELIKHLSELYADWSSIPLYAADNDAEILTAVSKFEDLINEAKKAASFEDLIKNDFFNRLRILKDDTGENFFSPVLTATAIESNIEIGNIYVELIGAGREKNNVSRFDEKYKNLLDQSVSDATSKTFQLVELLKNKKDEEPPEIGEEESTEHYDNSSETDERAEEIKVDTIPEPTSGNSKKFLFAAVLIALVIALGFFAWRKNSADSLPAENQKVNLEDSSLVEYFKTARIDKGVFYAVTQPSWNELSPDKKTEILKKTFSEGAKKGYTKVQLMDNDGKFAGSISAEGVSFSDLQ